jgi:diacylglycerol kinase family enzyme
MGPAALNPTKTQCVVIANRCSGSFFSIKKLYQVVARTADGMEEIVYCFPETRQATIEQAYSSVKSGVRKIMVWGGDGSINAVVHGIMRAQNEGAIRPILVPLGGGSGSDFIRSLRLKNTAALQTIDIGVIELINEGTVSYFINGFSCGVTAEIAHLKGSMPRWLPGPLKYLLATFVRLAWGKLFSNALIGNQEHSSIMSLLTLNGQFVGGGMRILSDTSLEDGVLEQVLLPKMSIWSILNIFKSVYLSGIRHHPEVIISKISESIEIILPKVTQCEIDGETFGANRLRISIQRQSIIVENHHTKHRP